MPDASGPEAPLLLKVSQAAALLNIGRNAAYELIRRDELPHVLVGKSIRVPRADLESYVRSLPRANGASEHIADTDA